MTFVPNNHLGCDMSNEGTKWIYKTRFSDVFITLHIIILLIHAALTVWTYYRIPKEFNVFGDKAKKNNEG